MVTDSSGRVWGSAGCLYSAGIPLYSAHIGTTEGPLRYQVASAWYQILVIGQVC